MVLSIIVSLRWRNPSFAGVNYTNASPSNTHTQCIYLWNTQPTHEFINRRKHARAKNIRTLKIVYSQSSTGGKKINYFLVTNQGKYFPQRLECGNVHFYPLLVGSVNSRILKNESGTCDFPGSKYAQEVLFPTYELRKINNSLQVIKTELDKKCVFQTPKSTLTGQQNKNKKEFRDQPDRYSY